MSLHSGRFGYCDEQNGEEIRVSLGLLKKTEQQHMNTNRYTNTHQKDTHAYTLLNLNKAEKARQDVSLCVLI